MTSSTRSNPEDTPALRRPLRLSGTIQRYTWGKIGQASRLAAMVPGKPPEEPLAEFWLGGHPKGCSMAQLPDGAWLPLTELCKKHPGLLGPMRHPQALPFMLKVLSVDPSWGLSIQAHPDLELARKLHLLDPANYPDASHKPEVGVPLSPVTLLYGFRDAEGLRDVLARFPELKEILGVEVAAQIEHVRGGSDHALVRRAAFEALLGAPRVRVEEAVRSVSSRFQREAEPPREVQILERLRKRYGDRDVGLLALFVLNVVEILPGKAIYIAPNVPHAYLEGDLVECMACSDNVVRAGLTHKFKDVQTLLQMLDYSVAQPEITEPKPGLGGFLEFQLPIREFSLRVLPHGSGFVELQPSEGKAEMLLCLGRSASIRLSGGGEAMQIRDGESILLPVGVGACLIERSDAAIYRVTAGEFAALQGT